jgi:lantibiotic transport system ATP-binding protein
MYCLETTALTHRFSGGDRTLHDVNMRVTEGSIYGFLGANGAGKTTTLRLILGLLKLQRGSISIFGQPFHDNRVAILQKVGSLIETPSIYGHLTAYENLSLLQKVYRCPRQNIIEALRAVDLPTDTSKKAGQFSLGMKQRLGIAIALLHHPALLILDEPTNGLDPNGMIEIRELLLRLNRQKGTTIIISSHLLNEIERLVTHVGIISKGTLMFQGSLGALRAKQQQVLSVVLETDDATKAARIIDALGLSCRHDDGKLILPAMPRPRLAEINRILVHEGVNVYEIKGIKNDLESIFMDLIAR